MSPRNKKIRKVLNLPLIKGFKPYGLESAKLKGAPINMLYEEYEALRLCDYDLYNHCKAAEEMNVSRPTYTRIYASARKKVAKAFVEGRQILIEGGKVYFDSDWYHCQKCGCFFNNPEKENTVRQCPLCGSEQFKEYDYENNYEDRETKYCDNLCVCPECGFEQIHQNGLPCGCEICPKCGALMRRKRNNNCNNR